MERDPVCDAPINELSAIREGLSTERFRRRFYFCSGQCKRQFEIDPLAFACGDWPMDDTDSAAAPAGADPATGSNNPWRSSPG